MEKKKKSLALQEAKVSPIAQKLDQTSDDKQSNLEVAKLKAGFEMEKRIKKNKGLHHCYSFLQIDFC